MERRSGKEESLTNALDVEGLACDDGLDFFEMLKQP